MKSYLSAKLILFKKILSKKSSLITDKDNKIFKILKKISLQKKFSMREIEDEIVKIKEESALFKSDYKIKNLAMAIKAAKVCGLKEKRIYESIKRLKEVNGRLELVKIFPNNIKVFIDYAHTPDALLKTLNSLKEINRSNIYLVFGCGGDRDQLKRPLMAKIADKYCKKVFITDDNPRNENPIKIRTELAKYISKKKMFNIGNRSIAIKTAIRQAEPEGIVLIAGKGHEEQQIYKNKIKYISDKKIVKKVKLKTRIIPKKELNYLQNRLIFEKIFNKKIQLNFNGLSIDSRTIQKDNLFLALKGKKNDGKKFILNALKKRAGCVITSSAFEGNKKKIIKVKNPNSFLNSFARHKRECSTAKIISVTGSAGKTSLKNLLKNLLGNIGKTYSSPKSFNNNLGVPISLSNLSSDDKYGVIEVGMSKAGEIKSLSKLIKPHIGIITNIGEAHLENFKNINGIANAKAEIIENVQSGGTMILNRDDKFFNYLLKKAKNCKLKVLTFGYHKKSDVRLKKIIKKKEISKVYIQINKKIINFEIRDLNIYNILAAVAVIKDLKINFKKIKSKFKNLESSDGRGKKYSISRYKKKFKFIDESYNANPLSVKNAIKKLNSIKKDNFKKYLVLGDMLELGSKSQKYHEEISKVINRSDIDKVFIKGNKTIFTYKHLNKDKRGNILQNDEDIDFSLSKMISNNDYLMIKGSNATGLNEFSKKMIKGL